MLDNLSWKQKMTEAEIQAQDQKPKTSKLAKLSLGFTVISILCFMSFFFTVTNIASILFLLSVIVAVILGIVSIFKIKLSNGKLKDMGLAIIGGIIIPVVLVGIVLAGIVVGTAMDRATAVARLIICKKELETLGKALQSYSTDFDGKYPTAGQWCDLLAQYTSASKISFGKFATGRYLNYAINPKAEPNSPSDVVLLFETDGGWNQAGGVELLTFENKKPKGCMTLFNGGHIKLVKPEDADGLKWK